MSAPTNMISQPFINPRTGGCYLDNGNFVSDGLGGITITNIRGGQSSLATIASSGTITTSGVRIARTTVGGAVTSCVLQAGLYDGQEVTVINENATGSNTISFAASGTSNYASPAAISGLTGAKFTWDGGTSLWYRNV